MSAIQQVDLELSVILGTAEMPIHQLLRMGHGAVIELNSLQDEDVMLLINNQPVAKGKVIVSGEAIAVEVRDMIYKPQVFRERQSPLPKSIEKTQALSEDTEQTHDADLDMASEGNTDQNA